MINYIKDFFVGYFETLKDVIKDVIDFLIPNAYEFGKRLASLTIIGGMLIIFNMLVLFLLKFVI